MDRARMTVYRVLYRVLEEGSYLHLALKEQLERDRLNARDRAFATQLIHLVLTHRARLDYALAPYLVGKRVKGDARTLMRMGACQIMLMRLPHRAAVDSTVELCRELRKNSYGGFMNGVLRNLVRGLDDIAYPEDPLGYLTIYWSIPEFVAKMWLQRYGVAGALSLAESLAKPRGICVCAWDQAEFMEFAGKHGLEYVRGRVSPYAFYLRGRSALDADRLIMGEAAQMAALAMDVQPGERVLDACAAPGGKTVIMAEAGGDVTALELHENRKNMMEVRLAARNTPRVTCLTGDAALYRPEWEQTFDRVLVDAPCSGLGTLAQKPDIKWRLAPEDLTALADLQLAILTACGHYVKTGGTLVYSTCTLSEQENDGVVRAFLAERPEFDLDDLSPYFPERMEEAAKRGFVELRPDLEGTEGFFIARMRRRS